jgi:chromosome segregation ATPase
MELTLSIPTLIICLIVFVLFRVLDKKNRGLEKLKRFSDKTKEELGAFIKEKSLELNDLSVNIDSQLKKSREILTRILSFEEMLQGKADDFDKMKKTVDTYSASLDELINMSGRVDENLKRLGEESQSVEKMGAKLKDSSLKLAKIDTELKTTERRFIEQARGELRDTEEKLIKTHEEKIHVLLGDVGRMEARAGELDTYLKKLEAKKQEAVKLAEAAIGQALKSFEQDVGKKRAQETAGLKSDIDAFMKEADDKNQIMTENLVQVENRVKELDVECSAKIDDFKDQFGQVERMFYTHLENAAKRGEDFEDEVFLNLKKSIDERGRAGEREAERYFQLVHGSLEKRKKEIVELFGALRADTNIWHAELKKQMKSQEKEIEVQLKNLEAYAKTSIETFTGTAQRAEQNAEEKVGKSVSSMQAKMKELETGFAESRRVLNDRTAGFEKDIRERLALLEKEVKGLLGSLDREVTDKISAAGTEAQKLYDQITAGTTGVETRVLESIEQRLGEYEDAVQYRFTKLEKANIDIDVLDKSLRETMTSTADRIRSEFTSFSQSLESERASEQARAAQELDSLREEIESIESGVSDLKARAYENVSSRLKLVEDEFFKDIRVQSGELKQQVSVWREEIMQDIAAAGLANAAEIEKLGAAHAKRLEKELVGLRKSTEADFKALDSRVAQFERDCEERIAAKEQVLAGLTQEMEKSKEKAITAQRSFFDSFDVKMRSLEGNLAEIEKQQKNFTAQTKIFERADSLKLSLESDLGQMKKDIGKIEAYRKDIDVISKDFFTTKKLVEETGAKMRDFITEKKRIDSIEVDFQKLLELSRGIDEKLDSATSQHDLLQSLEIKFRELESLETDVETRYTRLEGRKNVIETTTRSVDKNFEQLSALEKNLKAFERELKVLPKLVGDVKKEVEFIGSSQEKTEKVAGKVEKLDETLADVEARMEKLSVARDWLARTETRLDKVNKQAEEQLKLLETLVRDEVSRFKKEKGAPSPDKRQTVTKLARQGWSAEEIARATKLSRGEVELILELISDKVAK